MNFSFKNIIIPIVVYFFMLSACEVSTQYFKNTFDDDYDYFIQPNNIFTNNMSVNLIFDFTLPIFPTSHELTILKVISPSFKELVDIHLYSPPFFLKNCILII